MKTFVFISIFGLLISTTDLGIAFPNVQYLKSLAELKAIIEHTAPTTKESKDGTLTIRVTGGLAPYVCVVMGSTFQAQTFHESLIELRDIQAGNYTILIQDSEKKFLEQHFEIESRQ